MSRSGFQSRWAAALDGGKALIWRDQGFPDHPDLRLSERHAAENPPAREQGDDRPGRFHGSGDGRSAVQLADPHEKTKADFIRSVIERLNLAASRGAFDQLVLFAPAPALGEARRHYEGPLKARLIEVEADLTHAPTAEIEQRLAALKTGKPRR